MKILNIIPIISDIWTDEMQKYVTKDLLPTTEVVSKNIRHGPASIEGEYDEALAVPEVLFLTKKAEKDGFDAVFIDCFGEPGVRAARELVNIPVFGGFEPAIFYALGVADRIGIVSVLPEVVPLIREVVDRESLQNRISSIRYVNIPVLSLEDIEKLAAALIKESVKAIDEDHVEMIVLGCTAMVGVKERVEEGLKIEGYDVVVIEAAQAALMMLETYVRMGLKHSVYTYPAPREKKRAWWGGDIIVDII
ncbi:MAG: aspartate/glutamate racemase family protein [Treponema sp.]|jgi:allantoin racemase|nr:aspartate/glutamate racemase family protein [Treponema sp.]